MLCEWERARGERPPPILAREPQGSRAFIFSRHPFVSALGPTFARNLELKLGLAR